MITINSDVNIVVVENYTFVSLALLSHACKVFPLLLPVTYILACLVHQTLDVLWMILMFPF